MLHDATSREVKGFIHPDHRKKSLFSPFTSCLSIKIVLVCSGFEISVFEMDVFFFSPLSI